MRHYDTHVSLGERRRAATLIPDQLRRFAGKYPDEVGFTVVGSGDLTLGEWRFHDALPRNAAAKVLKRELREG